MSAPKTKVAVVGAGKTGAAIAHALIRHRVCDELVLTDLEPRRAWAEALDLQYAAALAQSPVRIRDGSYYDCADAELCILAAATHPILRTPFLDAIDHSAAIIGRVVPSLMGTGFSGTILVLSNPVSLMTWLVQQLSGLPEEAVLGIGTAVETIQLRMQLAALLRAPVGEVEAYVLGEPEGERMAPWSCVRLRGEPLAPGTLEEAGVVNTAAELFYNLCEQKHAPTFTLAGAAAMTAGAILRGEKRVLPVSTALHGEYGEEDVCIGVPAVVGRGGVESVVELPLDEGERAEFSRAARFLRQYMTDIA